MQADNTARPQSVASSIVLGFCGALLFIGFVALGSWQVKRLYWKRALIEHVEQRVNAPAAIAPGQTQWNKVTAESDGYRHVYVSGVFLDSLNTQVVASTQLGRGFWLMTPLRLDNGSIIFINRGFIPFGSRPCATKPELGTDPNNLTEVTGLLRNNEPGGAFLRSNNPALQQWYSRDVEAMATSRRLSNVAPFFIDAQAGKTPDEAAVGKEAGCKYPVAGLTVIAFYNNHLVYAVIWYTLGLMVLGACFIFWRTVRTY